MSDAFTFLIRFVHVASAVTWVGGASLWTMLIAPAILRRGPPPVRRPFLEAVLARFTRFMIFSASLTILSGFWVMGLLVGFGDVAATFQGGAYGVALGVGVVAAVLAFAEGIFVIKPTGAKLLATMQTMAASAPPTPETQAQLEALGKKVGIAGLTSLMLVFVGLGAMVWAVNTVRLHG